MNIHDFHVESSNGKEQQINNIVSNVDVSMRAPTSGKRLNIHYIMAWLNGSYIEDKNDSHDERFCDMGNGDN